MATAEEFEQRLLLGRVEVEAKSSDPVEKCIENLVGFEFLRRRSIFDEPPCRCSSRLAVSFSFQSIPQVRFETLRSAGQRQCT